MRQTWVRRALPVGLAAVIVLTGTVVSRANADAGPNDTYRTTTVTNGSVQQRLNVTGSAQRVNQVSESFAVAGTLSSVSVGVGDKVTAGQTLATLDPAPLRSAVIAARASLAKARANLESDQNPTTTTSTTNARAATQAQPATPNASATTTPGTSPRASSRSVASANQGLATAQKHVTNAQRTIAADLGQATSALAQCAPFLPSGSGSRPTPDASSFSSSTIGTGKTHKLSTRGSGPNSATDTTPITTPTASPPSGAAIKACLGALQGVPTQQQILQNQHALTSSQTALTKVVTALITTAGDTATVAATNDRSGSSTQSASSQSATSQPATSQPATSQSATSQSSNVENSATGTTGQSNAARVDSDKAAVTNAEAALSSATQNQTSATLKSSTAGTVGSVGFVKGSSSSGQSIVIVGAGAVDITVNVPLASMASVHIGQKANVTPQGATTSVPGTVTSISLLPTATATGTGTGTGTSQATATTSSPTYPVVVRVPEALPSLASGSRGDVSLLIGTAGHVLTVPNSALTPLGNGQALALMLENGVTTRVLVKTGYVGTLTTQVRSGLIAGQQVVLADLSTALPTNTTNTRRFGVRTGANGGATGAAGLSGGLGGGTGFGPPG